MSRFAASKHRSTAAAISLLAAVAPALTAQTKLRDPQQSVFAAFPAANGYQAIVRAIDPAARRRIEERLPFPVHFNELGEHTVYVALRDRVPLGMVYVMCEEETFGLTEVRWGITLDMQLAGFEFQRTRSRHREAVQSSEFARLLHGRRASDLAPWLTADGRLKPDVRGVPQGTEELASALARSAMKALTVVDEVWVTEVVKLHDLAVGSRAFPTALRFARIWPPEREHVAPADDSPVRVDYVVRALGRESRELGVVALTHVAAPNLPLWWTLDANGVVIAVQPEADAAAALRSDCLDAIGRKLHEVAGSKRVVARSAAALQQALQPAPPPPR